MNAGFNPVIPSKQVKFKATFRPNGDQLNNLSNAINKSVDIAPSVSTVSGLLLIDFPEAVPAGINSIKSGLTDNSAVFTKNYPKQLGLALSLVGHFIKENCDKIKIKKPIDPS